jgi:dTDP-4-amino-4,6-dideoxygalactose transaminase
MIVQTNTKNLIPYHAALIEEQDIVAVTEVLRSGWITTGPKVRQFEQSFAKYTGATNAVAVNSGTAALHLALDAIGLKEGDEVVVPTMTFAATAEAVLHFRAQPVLVDCEPRTYNLDANQVEKAITARTKAIIPVHFRGHPCDMDQLLEIARHRNVKVIEDAAHALPAHYKGKMVGSIGDITCFSFYATKTITTGEGGMATTENAAYADRMRLMSLHGISRDGWARYGPRTSRCSWRYEILEAGYKYNLTDLQAALGLSQLSKCDYMWERRQALAAKYSQALSPLDAFVLPETDASVQPAWHIYAILVNPEVLRIDRDEVIEQLRERGIGTAVHFIPLHLHPLYQRDHGCRAGQFPYAENYSERAISLPIYPGMTNDDAEYVIDSLKDIATRLRR